MQVDHGAFMLEDDASDVSDGTDIGSAPKGVRTGPVLLAGHVPLSKRQEQRI
jgi:hypothetical protein